jgi:hypothetical protein
MTRQTRIAVLAAIAVGLSFLILAALAHGGATDPKPGVSAPQWYNTSFRPGILDSRLSIGTRLGWDRFAGVVYFLAVTASLFWYASRDATARNAVSDTSRVWVALLVTLAPPAWFFLEARSLEAWLQIHNAAPAAAELERSYFQRMTEHARNLWAALVAVYAALLISFRSG